MFQIKLRACFCVHTTVSHRERERNYERGLEMERTKRQLELLQMALLYVSSRWKGEFERRVVKIMSGEGEEQRRRSRGESGKKKREEERLSGKEEEGRRRESSSKGICPTLVWLMNPKCPESVLIHRRHSETTLRWVCVCVSSRMCVSIGDILMCVWFNMLSTVYWSSVYVISKPCCMCLMNHCHLYSPGFILTCVCDTHTHTQRSTMYNLIEKLLYDPHGSN